MDHPTLPGDVDHLVADDHAIVGRVCRHLEAATHAAGAFGAAPLAGAS